MRAAIVIVVCLAGLAIIIQRGSACSLTLDRVRQGCAVLKYVLGSNPPDLNVCGQNSALSCQIDGVGIVDKSVRVQNFEVHAQCMIQGPYQWYKDPAFFGRVTGARIVLTGKQQGINGQEGDFSATIHAHLGGRIDAEIDTKQCVKKLSSKLNIFTYGDEFQEISSESSRQELLKQLGGALNKMVNDIISQVPSMLG